MSSPQETEMGAVQTMTGGVVSTIVAVIVAEAERPAASVAAHEQQRQMETTTGTYDAASKLQVTFRIVMHPLTSCNRRQLR